MLCPRCKVEMLIDTVEERESDEIFHYKCRNPACPAYAFKTRETGSAGHETENQN